MSRTAGRTRFPPLVWMYWPIFGIRSICDWTCRPNSRSTRSRSARIGSKSCARAIDDFSTAVQVRTLSWPEQRVEVGGRARRDVMRRDVVELRKRRHDEADVSRLVSLPAMRHRRQKRAVRFGEEPVERHSSDHVAELDRFWKGEDAGQRNVEAEIEPGASERRIAREAMQNALHRSAAVLAEDRNRILIRFA